MSTGASAASYLGTSDFLADFYDTGEGIFYVLGIVSVAQLLSVFGIFNWQKWGVYLYAAMAIIGVVISIALGIIAQAVGGLVVGGIIFFYRLFKAVGNTLNNSSAISERLQKSVTITDHAF